MILDKINVQPQLDFDKTFGAYCQEEKGARKKSNEQARNRKVTTTE